MAHYLPVLLVSVNTNAVPDDSALVTLPRGQVDYLSHEWQEEDVWRSWRNMTRQKNAIANGARLENASWRTWWKQRNKLKTISPETLNWLKDSDVTWLYGPLHTAVEWTPPPKPKPVPDSVDSANPASAHDRLDLSSSNPSFLNIANARRAEARPAKPILKHRSIGEILTGGDYQPSFAYSPRESDEEEDESSPTSAHSDTNSSKPRRPSLTHTKSDTHIIRFGSSRAFRKDSPPRIDPPGFDAENASYFPPQDPTSALAPSTSSSSQFFSSHPISATAPGAIRSSVSQDSTSTSSGGQEKPEKQKKKHISFNTFVEQCIAIEKPKKNASGYFGAIGPAPYASLYGSGTSASYNSIGNHNDEGEWIPGTAGYVDDDGYDEDQEDDDDLVFRSRNSAAWQAEMGIGAAMRAVGDDSDESPTDEALEDVDEVVEEDIEDDGDDDGAIQIRSRRGSSSSTLRPGSFNTSKKTSRAARSQSKVSTSSSSSATSSSSAASGSSQQSHGTTPGTSTSTSPNSSLSPSRRPKKGSASTVSAGSKLTATPSDPSVSSSLPIASAQKRVPSSSYRPSAHPAGYVPSYHAHRPPLIRTPSEHVHVTIAPIAPTLLKTTGAWAEGFGDDGSDDAGFVGPAYGWSSGSLDKVKSDRSRSGSSSRSGSRSGSGSGERDTNRQPGRHHGRGNGFDSQTVDLDPGRDLGIPTNGGGYIANPTHGEERMGRGRRWEWDPEDDDGAQVSDGTPVELVYVPPLGSNYSFGLSGNYGGGPYADGIYGGHVQGAVEEEDEEDEQYPAGLRHEDDEDDDEGNADAVYHHPPLSSSPGLGTSAPIPIASVTQYPHMVEVPNGSLRRSESSQNFAAPTSLPKSSSFMQQRPSANMVLGGSGPNSVSSSNVTLEEEDENDFFGGPDFGEDYYYARRGGRGYDRGVTEAPVSKSSSSPAIASSANGQVPGYVSQGYGYAGTGYAAQMQRERERETAQREREKRDRASDARSTPIIRTSSFGGGGGLERRSSRSGREGRDSRDASVGEERQGRSRSRSQSRTPSPAMLSSSSPGTSIVAGGRKRSSSGSSSAGPAAWMSSGGGSDLLSPPTKPPVRPSASSSLLSSGRPTQSSPPTERQGRGRSSTRTPSSSLSPDGISARSGSTAGIGAVLAGSGRVGREPEDDRRGRERRGRDRTSGKVLGASEAERTVSESSKDGGSTTSGSVVSAPVPGNMEASFYSATSEGSSASNTSTIVGPTPSSASPPPLADPAQQSAIIADIAEQNKLNELRYLRRAEEDQMRRAHPTPSNSPVVDMRITAPPGVGETYTDLRKDSDTTPATSKPAPATASPTSAPLSPPKLRPPPIVPTTGSPSKPSTSFISSPRRSSSIGSSADVKFQALANMAVPSPSGNVNPTGEGESGGADGRESTIVGKAVDMMSSAGAFLGLWGREKEKTGEVTR